MSNIEIQDELLKLGVPLYSFIILDDERKFNEIAKGQTVIVGIIGEMMLYYLDDEGITYFFNKPNIDTMFPIIEMVTVKNEHTMRLRKIGKIRLEILKNIIID